MGKKARKYITPAIEKRQHRRAKLMTEVRCEALGRNDVLVTRDVSAGGLFISAKRPFAKESEVALYFRLKPAGPVITCRGRVVYSIDGMGMGILFIDLNEEDRHTVQKFVDETE